MLTDSFLYSLHAIKTQERSELQKLVQLTERKKNISTETRIFTARKLSENGNRRDGRQRVSQKCTIAECKRSNWELKNLKK